MRSAYTAIDLGPLPVELVNTTLGTELEPGHARLRPKAHQHMAEDHAEDYPICIAELRNAIAARHTLAKRPAKGAISK